MDSGLRRNDGKGGSQKWQTGYRDSSRAFLPHVVIPACLQQAGLRRNDGGLGERFQATALALSLVVVGLVVLSLGSC